MQIVSNAIEASSFMNDKVANSTINSGMIDARYDYKFSKINELLLIAAYQNNEFVGYLKFDKFKSTEKQIIVDM